jgi:hypothetical protein
VLGNIGSVPDIQYDVLVARSLYQEIFSLLERQEVETALDLFGAVRKDIRAAEGVRSSSDYVRLAFTDLDLPRFPCRGVNVRKLSGSRELKGNSGPGFATTKLDFPHFGHCVLRRLDNMTYGSKYGCSPPQWRVGQSGPEPHAGRQQSLRPRGQPRPRLLLFSSV